MKTSKIKKICSVVMAAMLGVSVLTGCGSSNSSSSTGASAQELTFNLGSDVKTLDPALNQAVDSSILLVNMFEGLYKLDENQKAIPGVAEKCDISRWKSLYIPFEK